MIEAMWIWGAVGVALIALEMAIATFFILWFGVGALCVALATAIYPNITQSIQFFIFAVLSLISLGIYQLKSKKSSTHSHVGQAQGEEIGRIGIIIEPCSSAKSGKVRFTQGLMGSREWEAVTNEMLDLENHVTVIAVEGNALRVKKCLNEFNVILGSTHDRI